jgi:hypothetical protein
LIAGNGFALDDKRLIMKRILILLGCSVFAISSFSQDAAELNNKMAATSVVASVATGSDVNINPNPVQGETFSLELQNLQKGKYSIYMFNEQGKRYLVKVVNVDGGTLTESLQLPKNADKGVYILQVISKTSRFCKKMIVE